MAKQSKTYDIILISGEPYADHPFSGIGILKRVLEDKGFSVAIIETPDWKKDSEFTKFGKPNLFFGITSGSMDSMIVNYTPLKKKRSESEFEDKSYEIPDRAVTVYSNMIKKNFKDSILVLGGTESSLRRFVHYDYWDNKLRRSILFDTRADILVYGYGEKQIIEIAQRIKNGTSLDGINGTCILSKNIPEGFTKLPACEIVLENKEEFVQMQKSIDVNKNLSQECNGWNVLQYKAMEYTTKDLDYIYGLPYTREIPESYKELKIVEFSVITHRGCFGGCNFCSINALNGKTVVSRSIDNILDEIKRITKILFFDGYIELSGASANMYGMDCANSTDCKKNCLHCSILDSSHSKMIELLRKAREVKGVYKVIIKSGVRYDLALKSPEYIKEIITHHIDNTLMIAPEHTNKKVLEAMNKPDVLSEFKKTFYRVAKEENKDVILSYYLMVGHPECTLENSKELNEFIKNNEFSNFVQMFTPTPMTDSTCMYYTGLNPKSHDKVYVPYSYNEKKMQKNYALDRKSNRQDNDNFSATKHKNYGTNNNNNSKNSFSKKPKAKTFTEYLSMNKNKPTNLSKNKKVKFK